MAMNGMNPGLTLYFPTAPVHICAGCLLCAHYQYILNVDVPWPWLQQKINSATSFAFRGVMSSINFRLLHHP